MPDPKGNRTEAGGLEMKSIEQALTEALAIGRQYVDQGECASYIPELSRADKHALGVCVMTASTDRYAAGDTKTRFSIQSISKVITLAVALQHCGFEKVFEKMNMEPSGDPFNSLVKLDLTDDKPFNPMINAGAITTAGYLEPDVSFEDLLAYSRRVCLDEGIEIDERCMSRRRTTAPETGPSLTCFKARGF